MRWMFAGALLVLMTGVAAAASDDARVVKSIPVDDVRLLVYHGSSRLHLLPGGKTDFVRIEGPQQSVNGVAVREERDRLVIDSDAEDVDIYVSLQKLQSVSMGLHPVTTSSRGECKVVVTGDARAHLDAVVADTVQIYVDGAARLNVGTMTASTIAGSVDGNGQIRDNKRSY